MFIPARKARGSTTTCTRLPRLLTVATTGAVFMGAGFGVLPASADPQPEHELSVMVDIVGDSYMAGEGLRDTYIDPADPRHRSSAAPALQALARVQSDNSRLRVDANLVAAAGAETVDFFHAQAGQDNVLVNAPQRDQVRPDAQLVIVGFGGDDAQLATVLAEAQRTTSGPNTELDKKIRDLAPLLDWTASDEDYIAQAKSSAPGQAPTLVARMVQVLAGIMARAPQAKIVVTTYPLAADPENGHAASLVGEDELTSVRKFGYDLNKAIDRAVQICACGSLADLSGAVAGHEIYTADSAFNEARDQQAPQEAFQPNDKGASLIANPIANSIASLLQITAPEPSDGRVTVPENIKFRGGVSDRDGDTVADFEDRAPDDPSRSADDTHQPDTKHATDNDKSSHHGPNPKHSNDTHQPHGGGLLTPIIRAVAPGVSPIGPYDRPAEPAGDNKNPVTVDSRPPAREQTAPPVPTAQAPEPAAAGPVPGEDSAASKAWSAAMQDVILKAQPAGYVSQYSTKALRAATTPADERGASDKAAVDRQMSQSFLGDEARAGFRDQFGKDIDAIHNATTVKDQDAAIARFDQTVSEYNTTELAARDAYGAHPVDAQGETVRVTPNSLADLATAETTTYGPVEATTLPAFDGLKTGTVVDPGPLGVTYGPVDATAQPAADGQLTVTDVTTEATTYGTVDTSTVAQVSDQAQAGAQQAQADTVNAGSYLPSIDISPNLPTHTDGDKFGPATEKSAEGTAPTGETVSLEGRTLAGEWSSSWGVTKDGINGSLAGNGYVAEGTAKETTSVLGVPVSRDFEGKVLTGDANLSGKLGWDGVDVNVSGRAALVEGSVEDKAQFGPADLDVKGTFAVEANAGANLKATVKDGFAGGVHYFAGAKIGTEGKLSFPGVGLDFEGTVEGWLGPGFERGYRFGFDKDGKFNVGVDAGLSTLFGGKASWNIKVDPDKFMQSLEDAVESLNPWGPAEAEAPADFDSEYSGPTPGTTGENDDPDYSQAPADAPADFDSQYSGPTPGTTGENDDPSYSQAPAETPADFDSQYSGPTPGTTGENDDPSYSIAPAPDSPVNPDAAISNADPESDTIAGYAGTDTLGGETDGDTLGGETDTGYSEAGYSDAGYSDSGYSDSGAGETSDTSGGYGTSDAGDGTADGGTSGGFTGGGGDFGGGGATGDFGGTDSTGGSSTSGDTSTSGGSSTSGGDSYGGSDSYGGGDSSSDSSSYGGSDSSGYGGGDSSSDSSGYGGGSSYGGSDSSSDSSSSSDSGGYGGGSSYGGGSDSGSSSSDGGSSSGDGGSSSGGDGGSSSSGGDGGGGF